MADRPNRPAASAGGSSLSNSSTIVSGQSRSRVTLSPSRVDHVMERHAPGTNQPGAGEFPKGWGRPRIVSAIRKVLEDPASTRVPQPGVATKMDYVGSAYGIRIQVSVSVSKNREQLLTAWPIDAPRNPFRGAAPRPEV